MVLGLALAFSLSANPSAADEAHKLLRAVYVAQLSYYAEFDRYSTDANTLGFEPEPCEDGTRATAADGEIAGCRVVIKLTVSGFAETAEFTAVAKGKGVLLSTSSKTRGDIKKAK